jgi:hypothetical protein
MTQRLVTVSSAFLDRRTSRRGFLMRATVAGSALAVAPIRYLLHPESAWAITPGECSSGTRCRDGFTEFCCSAFDSNCCPPYTFVAGWWKSCDHPGYSPPYSGPGPCNGGGRYYVDCARAPGHSCNNTGGVGVCAKDSCDCRVFCQNPFTYCNANLHLQSCTYPAPPSGDYSPYEVVCRVISCLNPAAATQDSCGFPFGAHPAGVYDDRTCPQQPCVGWTNCYTKD